MGRIYILLTKIRDSGDSRKVGRYVYHIPIMLAKYEVYMHKFILMWATIQVSTNAGSSSSKNKTNNEVYNN